MGVTITGTGSYVPSQIAKNEDFVNHKFLNDDGSDIKSDTKTIIRKFKAITGIDERRYVKPEFTTSDIGFLAAEKAIEDAGISKEEIDYIIVAHNFGDVVSGSNQSDVIPSIATRIKHHLRIKNPKCVAYDLIFGCPGWVEGVIQANAFIKSGIAKKCLVIGAETLSRVVDKYDRDSMIFADGAGATVIEEKKNAGEILFHESATYANEEANYLYYGKTYKPESDDPNSYIKMLGRKIYEFALTHVPAAMKSCLDNSNIPISDVKKVFLHQANEKMDEAIIQRFYQLYGINTLPNGIMPMCIKKLGNSSVATIPTLLDMVKHGELENQEIKKGDIVIFASVGAGMNVNAIVYKV